MHMPDSTPLFANNYRSDSMFNLLMNGGSTRYGVRSAMSPPLQPPQDGGGTRTATTITTSDHHHLCDDIVTEILLRLPSKSVLRFRAVCRSWRDITTRPSFLAAHARRRPNDIIVFTESGEELAIAPFSLDVAGRRRLLRLRIPSVTEARDVMSIRTMLVGSCDGLLVLEQCPGVYIICNPVTRQWTNLPLLSLCNIGAQSACGFYLHVPSGEYRLLCYGKEEASGCWAYYILAASAAEPRRLGPSWTTEQNECMFEIPAAHGGSLYWMRFYPGGFSNNKMLAFETASETFRHVPRPPTWDGDKSELEMIQCDMDDDGTLGVVSAHNGPTYLTIDVWALDDEAAARPWRHRRRVRLPAQKCPHFDADMPWLPQCCVVVVRARRYLHGHGVSKDVIHVYKSDRAWTRDEEWDVGLYNLREKKMVTQVHLLHSALSDLQFKESLVQHAFFDQSPRCPGLSPLLYFSNDNEDHHISS